MTHFIDKTISNAYAECMHAVLSPFLWFVHATWKKKIIIGVIVIGSIVFLISSLLPKSDGYILGKVEKTSLTETVTESGSLIADGQTDVYSPATGIVQTVLVENGASVSAGQTLFTVKSTATEQEQQAAYTAYLTAQSAYNQADATANTLRASMYTAWKTYLDMAHDYETGDHVPKTQDRLNSPEFQETQDTWLSAEKNYKNQETAINAARAQMNAAWLAYQATQNATVKATTFGTVTNLAVAPGSQVLAYQLTNPPRPALSLISSTKVTALVDFGQSDIAKIQKGQSVVILPDAYKDKKYTGVVDRVDSIGRTVQGVVKYTVYMSITQADTSLRSGMTMDAEITTKRLDHVLTVPNAAIVLYQGKKSVRVLDKKNTMTYVSVVVGVKGQDRTEILSGLQEGQQIIISLTNERVQRPSLLGI